VRFPAGDLTVDIPVSVINDQLDEPDETIKVTILDNPTPTHATRGLQKDLLYTILDNDEPPILQFISANSSGDESISPAELQLELSAPSGFDLSVYYQVTGGTVTGGTTDFILPAGILTIPAGDELAANY
jgi:hypothetical protein